MFNIKKLVIVLSVVVIICFAISGSIILATGGFKNIAIGGKGNSYNLNDEKVESLDGIKEIYIDNSSAEISLNTENRKDVKSHFYGNINSTYMPKLETKIEGDKLIISNSNHPISFSIFSSKLTLDISIPENYTSKLKLKSGAGKVSLLSPMKLENLDLEMTSGSINLKDIYSSNLKLVSSAGSINGDNVTCENSNIRTTSGSLNLKDFKGNLNQESSAGKTNISFKEFNNNIKLKATAGSVTLSLPKNSQFGLKANSTAGSIKCDFPITVQGENSNRHLSGVVGNDKNKIDIDTSAGSINIKTNN